MKRKASVIILFFYIGLTFGYSMTIDELVNSYNYTYSKKDFSLNSYELKIIDENKIGLNLNITAKPQRYNLNLILSSQKKANMKSEEFFVENLNNIINITLEVSNLDEDNYTLSLFIYDEENILVYRNYNLSEVKINSEDFNLNNSYELVDLKTIYLILNSTNDTIFYEPQVLIQEEKSIIYFSDLAIKNISYDNLTGSINVEIVNFGNSDAIWYDFSVFDENYNLIHEHFETNLLQNQSKNLSLTLESNFSYFYVILDNNNNILENYKFNNILKWPVNLTENCKDDLDNNRDGSINENCNENFISENNQINSNLQENNSNSIYLAEIATGAGLGGGGGSGGSQISNIETMVKEENITSNTFNVISFDENEIKKEDQSNLFLDNFESKIEISNLNPEFVEITYYGEDIILSEGESINLDYENKL